MRNRLRIGYFCHYHNTVPINLRDLAHQAGVTPGTASKALSSSWRSQRIAPATVERVRQVAAELGYRPQQAARSVRTGRTGQACLLVDPKPWRSALPRPLLDALHDAAEASSLRLVWARAGDQGVGGTLAVRTCDAWVLNYHGALPEGLEAGLERNGEPCVWLGRADRHDALAADDAGAARALVERLLAQGRRRIAMLLPSRTVDGRVAVIGPAFAARISGWRAALEAAGHPARLCENAPAQHAGMRTWVATAADGADALLLHDPSPSLLAAIAAAFAHLPPASWPALACVGDLSQCAGLPVLCASLPWKSLGREAIALLQRRLAGGGPEPARLLPCPIAEPAP